MNIPPHIMLRAIEEAREAAVRETAVVGSDGDNEEQIEEYANLMVEHALDKLAAYVREWEKFPAPTEAAGSSGEW